MLKDITTNKQEVIVINLLDGTEYHYSWIEPVDALINTYMNENNLSMELHNPYKRDSIRNMAVLGKRTISIGNFCVMI